MDITHYYEELDRMKPHNVIKNYKKQVRNAEKALGMTDQQCLQLIYCYLDENCENKKISQSMLNICVNRPPCKGKEKELTFRNRKGSRKWCKGTGTVIGTPAFYTKAEEIVKDALKEQTERFENIPDNIKHVFEELDDDTKFLQKEMEKLKKWTMDYGQPPPIIESDIESGSEKKNNDFLSSIQSYDDLSESLEYDSDLDELDARFKRLSVDDIVKHTKSLQKEKKRIIAGMQVMTVTKQISRKVNKRIYESDDDYEIEDEQLDEQIYQGKEDAIEQLIKCVQSLDSRLGHMQEKVDKINETQDYLSRAARRQLGEEKWMEMFYRITKTGTKDILLNIVKAPIKMLNVIVLRPAYYAFWYFFGRFGYLLWGMLMLFLLALLGITFSVYASEHYPEYLEYLLNAFSALYGSTLSCGSMLAQYLKPIFGESLEIMGNWAVDTSYEIWYKITGFLLYIWQWLIELITNILKTAVENAVGGTVKSISSWIPSFKS